MILFFSPAVKLSNQLSFKAKFVTVSLLCVVPLLFFCTLLSQQQLNIAEKAYFEHNASRYIVPLRHLFEHIAQTRGMTNVYLNGNKGIKNKIVLKRKQVTQDFQDLLAINKQLSYTISTNGVPQHLKSQWQKINLIAFNGKPKQIFLQYTQLINDIINFMDTIGRKGRMLQDSNPINSYLINSLLHSIPNQVEALGKLRGKGAGVLSTNALTLENKLQVAALATTENAIKLNKDLEYIFAESAELSKQFSKSYLLVKNQLSAYLGIANNEIVFANSVNMQANEFFSQGTNTISLLLDLYDGLQSALNTRMVKQISNAKSKLYSYISVMLVVIVLLIYAYTGIYLAIRINLMAMMKVATDICEGDLNSKIEIETKDELQIIAKGITEIVTGLSRTIIAVRNSSKEIAIAAEQVASGSKHAAQGMASQSSELSETSIAITQMTASINEVAQNTELGSESAAKANSEATNGSEVVKETINFISTLADNIDQAASGTHTLKENSNNINSILDVIKGIAEQTNLLALNAAIEAARAGEQGRGFAVVADEVRTLAGRTQNATLEIQEMIEIIQSGIGDVSHAMSTSQEHAAKAVEYSKKSGQVLNSISKAVNDITTNSSAIAASVEEQSVVSEQVSKSIIIISDVAYDASQEVLNLSKTGLKLSSMSREMNLLIERYQLDENA